MIIELIIAFFLVRYLRKSIVDNDSGKSWGRALLYIQYALPVLFVFDSFVLHENAFAKWIGDLVLFAIIGIAYIQPDFRSVRNVIVAVLPFALVGIAQDIIGIFHFKIFRGIKGYLDVLYPCTIAWMIAMVIINKKQRKALEKEREKRQREEEQSRIIAARKTELEKMVSERTVELVKQKEELEHALEELKTTQAQLIQKEKMASLGELTAGIAHEIQNPLNFVNNFSDVNKELIDEMQVEINKGNIDEVKAIATDIKDNEDKISYHGKRADAIVKGMLQHSRASSGKKEPTDINALADEYLRLSYHGLRAKDKSFNATFKTHFDETVEKISVMPQDIGRVLLNLFNNAFYSVTEKKKQLNGSFEPEVSVTTQRINLASGVGGVKIIVRDNGLGIPQKVLDKIYQPFFTTKPAGQGTGLGLSLSYEIVKAHGGELKLQTKEGEFAEFVIELPYLL